MSTVSQAHTACLFFDSPGPRRSPGEAPERSLLGPPPPQIVLRDRAPHPQTFANVDLNVNDPGQLARDGRPIEQVRNNSWVLVRIMVVAHGTKLVSRGAVVQAKGWRLMDRSRIYELRCFWVILLDGTIPHSPGPFVAEPWLCPRGPSLILKVRTLLHPPPTPLPGPAETDSLRTCQGNLATAGPGGGAKGEARGPTFE